MAQRRNLKEIRTRWTPIKFLERRHGEPYWLMRCVCGNERTIAYKSYIRGTSLSCGCYRKELQGQRGNNRLPPGESSKNQLMLIYRRGAARRNVPFELTRDEFLALTSADCHYCGSPPILLLNRKKYAGKGNGAYIYNGIDRVDSTLGYVMENCVPACRFCNYAKSDEPLESFKAWIGRLIQHQTKEKK